MSAWRCTHPGSIEGAGVSGTWSTCAPLWYARGVQATTVGRRLWRALPDYPNGVRPCQRTYRSAQGISIVWLWETRQRLYSRGPAAELRGAGMESPRLNQSRPGLVAPRRPSARSASPAPSYP